MDIRNSYDNLRSLLGVNVPDATAAGSKLSSAVAPSVSGSDSSTVTVSNAASQVSQTATDDGVRMDKVTSVQSALTSGTYNVSASAVAAKVVDSMLARS
ncbi:MAG: flagellar biosynthesis anti-sigma factor FlgM [Terracidiphilus sp.]|nr:flagellar biosynthesis anti-sigma factor FlgM [Terracidiphilus sp.]